jgi:hypothetical protein
MSSTAETPEVSRQQLLELDIDVRLAALWREAESVDLEWSLERVASYLRAAYARGYDDALSEDVRGAMCLEHGYPVPQPEAPPAESAAGSAEAVELHVAGEAPAQGADEGDLMKRPRARLWRVLRGLCRPLVVFGGGYAIWGAAAIRVIAGIYIGLLAVLVLLALVALPVVVWERFRKRGRQKSVAAELHIADETLELSETELAQIVKQLSDPDFDLAAAELLAYAYESYRRFACQVPGLLHFPDQDVASSYKLTRRMGDAHAPDLLLAASVIEFARREWREDSWELRAPVEAVDSFRLLGHAFALISGLYGKRDVERALPLLPSMEDAYSALAKSPVAEWLARYQLVPLAPSGV